MASCRIVLYCAKKLPAVRFVDAACVAEKSALQGSWLVRPCLALADTCLARRGPGRLLIARPSRFHLYRDWRVRLRCAREVRRQVRCHPGACLVARLCQRGHLECETGFGPEGVKPEVFPVCLHGAMQMVWQRTRGPGRSCQIGWPARKPACRPSSSGG